MEIPQFAERIAKEARKLVIARQDECMLELRVREEAEKAALGDAARLGTAQ